MNILFITADQWRGECLSALNHSHVKTPNLDALAADGVAFKRHYAQATPCGPSRASLYSGMYMQNHRSILNGTPLDARHTNVALEARKAGYEPALFGYTDVSLDPRSQDIRDGYEGVLPGMDPICHLKETARPWLDHLNKKGYAIPDNPANMFSPQKDYPGAENRGSTFAPSLYSAEDSNTAFLVDKTIEYLSTCEDKPWFAYLSFLSPHPPFIVAEPYNDMFDEKDMPLPVRRATWQEEITQHPWLEHYLTNQSCTPYTVGADSHDNLSLSDQELRQIKATYYGMIAEVDAQVGRLVNHLKKIGSYDNTLIIFTSDHGESLGDHWAHAKYTYFEETFYIPLIVRDPSPEANQTRGSIVDAFTESIDIMPTILDAIGVDIPVQCDGYSVLPFCRDKQPEGWRKECHMEFDLRAPYDGAGEIPLGLGMKQCMVNIIRGERYKYVYYGVTARAFRFEK
ncbi:MAG: alkaline phosphatase family protein [Sneathiella sp.]|nr:alkaline phosphatase family protein [Sneathiella sp.]